MKLYNNYMEVIGKKILIVFIFMVFTVCSISNISESQRNTCIYKFGENVLDYGIQINTISENFGDTSKYSKGEKVFRAIPKDQDKEDIVNFEKMRAATDEIYESEYGLSIYEFDTFTEEYISAIEEIGGEGVRPYTVGAYSVLTIAKIRSQIIKQLLLKEDKNAENYCEIFLSINTES